MMKKDGSSVGVFLKASREANPAAERLAGSDTGSFGAESFSAPRKLPESRRDPAGNVLAELRAGPMSPAAIAERLGLSVTEAITVLEGLERFGFVEIAGQGAQKLVKLTGQ